VKSLSTFEDLPAEDKAKVIGGLIMVGVAIVCFVVFIQFFSAEYGHRGSESLKSGSSIFALLPFLLALIYLMIILPMVVVGALATGFLAKRSFSYVIKGILALPLLVTGSIFLADALLFMLFGMFFSNLSVPAQSLLMMFAFFVTAMTSGYILKTKRAKGYLTKKN
jgi:hypothetical protein